MKTKHDAPEVPTITAGDFADGSDLMLWNPQLPPARWRREQLRARLTPTLILSGLSAGAAVATALAWSSGLTEILIVLGGLLILGHITALATDKTETLATEHRHALCRIEEHPGEFFLRLDHFTDLDTAARSNATTLFTALARIHTTPARPWLDPDLPHKAHLVVWDVLTLLRDTRAARELLHHSNDTATAELATTLTAIDDAIDAVTIQLAGCVVLIEAWEQKLRHRDLSNHADTLRAALSTARVERIRAAAEALPRNVFAYVTAARDVTHTGSFAWEISSPLTSRSRRQRPSWRAFWTRARPHLTTPARSTQRSCGGGTS